MKVNQSYCMRKLRIEFLKEGTEKCQNDGLPKSFHENLHRIYQNRILAFENNHINFCFRVIGQAATCIEKSLGMKFSMPSMNEDGN